MRRLLTAILLIILAAGCATTCKRADVGVFDHPDPTRRGDGARLCVVCDSEPTACVDVDQFGPTLRRCLGDDDR